MQTHVYSRREILMRKIVINQKNKNKKYNLIVNHNSTHLHNTLI